MNENSFLSIEKLVEFGMSLAVARQMVKSMNQTITGMHIPGAMNPMQSTTPQFYYAIIDNTQSGPYSEQELSRLILDKKVHKETYIWKPGMSKWDVAENIPEVLKLVILSPPPFNNNSL
ncbi:DUF4339 domain-containing protein [Bacteroides sp. 214]|uniref:DUF4339 domain-containing protein n=1 Tax=Bacteroides sp. 214 TaxID=2302935 RepID=UPI0013D1F382|nr:DUF4339 domain-containing protein [Bacteroides sp. 214]NDW11464.1 DUF4339 domain-containing protein [Bacteroides sp. 214]